MIGITVVCRRGLLFGEVRPFQSPRKRFDAALRRDPCAYCGGPGGTIDHIVPSSAGGPNGVGNLTGACARCNTRKGLRPLLFFLLGEAGIAHIPVPRSRRRRGGNRVSSVRPRLVHLPSCIPNFDYTGCVDYCPVYKARADVSRPVASSRARRA